MKMERCLRNIVSLGLAGSLLLAGCGKTEVGEDTGKAGEEGGAQAMGRYVETAYDVSGSLSQAVSFRRTGSGNLEAYDYMNGMFSSDDEGVSWQSVESQLPAELTEGNYILNMAVSPEGEMAVVYVPDSGGGEEQSEAGEAQPEEAQPEEAQAEEAQAGESEVKEIEMDISYRYMLIGADGSKLDLELPSEGYNVVNAFWFMEDGTLYASTLEGSIYEIGKAEGSSKVFQEISGNISFITTTQDYVIVVTNDKGYLYDKESGEEVQDTVFEEFFAKGQGTGSLERYSRGGTYPVYIAHDKENIVYLICADGVYRYAIGGNIMEQLVNGALSSLSDPSMGISGAVLMGEDSFFILYSGGTLVRFTYNPDIPATPEMQLSVYSLEKNNIVNQAVALFRNEHPEVYVKYNIGISDDSATTREDALKKLNTEIVAGNGPDIFVLDEMPIDSYISKGILRDLTPYMEALTEEEKQLDNISAAWKKDGAVYALPAQFTLPLAFGPEEDMKQITDLSTLADWVEKFRTENESGLIMGSFTEENLLTRLIPFCQPAWKDGNGQINQTALEEFFVQTKRIWDGEKPGITDKAVEDYEMKVAQYMAGGNSEQRAEKLAASATDQSMEYAVLRQQLVSGAMEDIVEFSIVTSSFKIKEREGSCFVSNIGQAKNVFIPATIVGISSSTANPEMAETLLGEIMSEKNLSLVFGIIPNHKKALQEVYTGTAITDAGAGGVFGSFAVMREDGTNLAMDIYWPQKEIFDQFDLLVNNADTAYVKDVVLEDAVMEEGVKILSGEISAAKGAEAVMQKVSIYLSE